MKSIVIFACMCLFINKISAQKIVFHDKDPFRHIETINTDYNALTSGDLQFTCSYQIIGRVTDSLYLIFSVPASNDRKSVVDTSSGLCQIVLRDKQVCTGFYTRQLSYTSGGTVRHAITYYFSKASYTALLNQTASDVRLSVHGRSFGSFHIDINKQDKISNAIRLVLSKANN